MRTLRRLGAAVTFALAALPGLASCEKVPSTGEGRVWTITTEPGRDGPRLTFKTDCRIEDTATGKASPLELRITGDATPAWRDHPANQQVKLRLVSIGGPVIPAQPLSLRADGQQPIEFGDGQAASETRQTAQGVLTCPTFVASGPAAAVRSLAGSHAAVGAVGGLTFRLDGEQVRGVSELLHRIDTALPR